MITQQKQLYYNQQNLLFHETSMSLLYTTSSSGEKDTTHSLELMFYQYVQPTHKTEGN